MTKVLDGGWFPLVIGFGIFGLLMTWRRGREIITRHRFEEEGPLIGFVEALATSDDPPVRVPGTAVFLNASATTTPLALRHNVEHNHVLHEQVVIFMVDNVGVPHIASENRITIDDLAIPDDGISLVTARFGFQDAPDVPAALRLAAAGGLPIDVPNATYFLSRITITPTHAPGMRMWRKRLFTATSRNAASPAGYFSLPENRIVALGSSIEL